MKNILNSFTGLNKKLITYLVIAVGGLILLFIVLGIISSLRGKRMSFDKVEQQMQDAAKAYYKDRVSELPGNNGGQVEVDALTLKEAGKIKDLSKITKKGAVCTGKVVVEKNGDYYLYTPYLDCGETYKTISLTDKIKSDNPVVTEKDGLYQIGDNLVFRGENVNNYVSFAGKKWRIIRINNDGTLRLLQDDITYTGVWDDRYNINKQGNTGINDYMISRLKDGLERIYTEESIFNDTSKSKIAFKNLCIGKRYEDETNNTGSVECATVAENMPVGLMQVNEYMVASLDKNCVYSYDTQCSNYNYLANYTKTTWTLTADAANTHKAYKFNGYGYTSSTASGETGLRLVIYLSGNLKYTSGNGTIDNPYVA